VAGTSFAVQIGVVMWRGLVDRAAEEIALRQFSPFLVLAVEDLPSC
jgi:hypothetical protein